MTDADLLERLRAYFVGPENLLLTLQYRLTERIEALKLADATLRGANMNRGTVERKVAAAIAVAGGQKYPPICRCSEEARNNRVAARMGAEFVGDAPLSIGEGDRG